MAIINETLFGFVSMTAAPVVRASQRTRVLVSVSGAHVAKPSVSEWSVQLQLPVATCAGTGLVSQAGVGSQAALRAVLVEQAVQAVTVADLGGYALRLRGGVEVIEAEAGFRATGGFAGLDSDAGKTSESGKTSSTGTTNGMNPIDPRDFRTSSPPG